MTDSFIPRDNMTQEEWDVMCARIPDHRRRFRFAVRKGFSKLSPAGESMDVRAFGIRVGYWPCLKAPFIEIALNTKRIEFWHGLPTYRV